MIKESLLPASKITRKLKPLNFDSSDMSFMAGDDSKFINQYYGQEIDAMKNSMYNMEERINNIELLRTTRPHIEEADGQIKNMLTQLKANIETLTSDFKNLSLRLERFVDLKDTLAKLNKEARTVSNVYFLKTIVVFYDAIKHSFAEDLNNGQLHTINKVVDVITNKMINRDDFREVYKLLLAGGFQFIPESKSVD